MKSRRRLLKDISTTMMLAALPSGLEARSRVATALDELRRAIEAEAGGPVRFDISYDSSNPRVACVFVAMRVPVVTSRS